MTHLDIPEKAIDVIIAMVAALINIRLYPPTSAMVLKSVEKVYPAIQEIIQKAGDLVFAESENNLLISGQPVREKDRKKPQVPAFHALLVNFGIKTLTFHQGLSQSELTTFLKILSRKPKDVQKAGGIKRILADSHLPHIRLDEKIYMSMSRDQQILAGMDIRDNEIVKYLTGDTGEKTVDKERIKEMAADPEWISGVFTSGLKYITEQKEDLSPRKLSEKFGYMIQSIDDISKHADKDQVSRSAAHSISRMDGDVLSLVLTKNLKSVMDAGLFTQIVDQIDDEKFKKLAVKIRFLHEKAGTGSHPAGFPDHEALDLAFTHLMASEKAKQLQDGIQEKYKLELALKKEHAVLLKTGLNSIMKGERHCFMDDRVMQNLPDTVEKLYQKGKSRTAELLIHRLCDGLTDDDPDIRDAAAGVLAIIHEEIRPLEGSALARLDPYLAKAEKAPPKADDGTQTPARDISGDLEIVDRHIQQNNGDTAVKFLFDRIVAYARDKQAIFRR